MPYAINMRSENQSSQGIRDLWSICERLEDEPSMISMGYPPHLTFAIFDEIDEFELTSSVVAVSSEVFQASIGFDRPKHFVGSNSIVLWAAPSDTALLADLHQRVHAHIDPSLCRRNYQPGFWVPHCSLAISIDPAQRDEAFALTEKEIVPFDVVFDVIDCARFHPVEVIHERILPSSV